MTKKIILPGIIAAVIMGAVGIGIGVLFSAIFPRLNDEYANTAMFRAMDDPLMILFWFAPLITGIVLAYFWSISKEMIKGKNMWSRGAKFGLAFWLVTTIPGMFITYSSFQVSALITFTWLLNGLTNGLISGWVFAKMNK